MTLRIEPELSAQGFLAAPNPLVNRALSRVPLREIKTIADQGCGRLRHWRLLRPLRRQLVLVDSHKQLSAKHTFGARLLTVREFVASTSNVTCLTAVEFARSRLSLDLILTVATYDVVLPETRRAMVEAARRNLRPAGYYVVIIPRNDSSILKRCGRHNQYRDGHVFRHHGSLTFYRNFRDHTVIEQLLKRKGFKIVADLSRYRQVCLVAQRA